jgi:outer membrane protein assembly factor BamB
MGKFTFFVPFAIISLIFSFVAGAADNIVWVDANAAGNPVQTGTPAEPFATIQQGINAVSEGATVIVKPGVYYENINFTGKAITVQSTDPHNFDVTNSTVIDGGMTNSCVVFDSNGILEGFKITNGLGNVHNGIPGYYGGGILCQGSSPTIRYCVISANGPKSSRNYGGGIALMDDCRATISNCVIVDNIAQGGNGGGIYVESTHTPDLPGSTIKNCTITNNTGSYQVCCMNTKTTITNTIIYRRNGSDVLISDPNLVTYSCINGAYLYPPGNIPFDITATGNNIRENPYFVPGTNYRLQRQSPCLNAGDPNYIPVENEETDIDGQPRVMAGRVDIGADEIVPALIVTKPKGSEVWAADSEHEINWVSYEIGGPVDIYYSIDGGSKLIKLKDDYPNTGSFKWTLPKKVNSDKCLVIIKSDDEPDAECIPSGSFTIKCIKPPWYWRIGTIWPTENYDFRRSGSSGYAGPEPECVKWQFLTDGPVYKSIAVSSHRNYIWEKCQHKGKCSCTRIGKFKYRIIAKDNPQIHIASEDGNLYTVDANTLLWKYDANSPLMNSPTITSNGIIYVGSEDGKLHSINMSNGQLRWTCSTDGFVASSAVVSKKGNVYFGSEDGILYALGADGSELWEFETCGSGKLPGSILASPAVDSNGTVYIGGMYDPNLYALNASDGSIKWTWNKPNNTSRWYVTSPVVGPKGDIYVTRIYDSNLYAIDSATGTTKWSVDLVGGCLSWFEAGYEPNYPYSYCWSEPALGPDGTIYVSLDDPYLRAIRPNGSIKWVKRFGNIGGFTMTVSGDGLIYAAGDDGLLRVIEPGGNEVVQFEGDGWLAYPVIDNKGNIYVSDTNFVYPDNHKLINNQENIYTNSCVWAISKDCNSQGTKPDSRWWTKRWGHGRNKK